MARKIMAPDVELAPLWESAPDQGPTPDLSPTYIYYKGGLGKPTTHYNQRTNGPVNAHLISWPSKAQNIQNLEYIW